MSERVNVFTYGTLRPSLDPMRFYARWGHVADPQEIGKGVLPKGTIYALSHFPAVVLDDGPGVVGEVISVKDLIAFDHYEGYDPTGGGLYDRTLVDILLDSKKPIKAWIYHMKTQPREAELIPSRDWAIHIRRHIRRQE